MRKIYLLLLTVCFAAVSNAQLTGTKNIPGDYATLAAAITDLNTQGVGAGGVTLNLLAGNPETAPAGGYVVGGAGSVVLTTSSSGNPVIIQGNGNTITASGAQTVGALTDAVFKLVGADWITITGFTIQENAGNIVNTPAASNTMTEWGVALLYVSLTDGSQNNTIQSNTISLNRTYLNTFGIYSNTRHSSTAVSTSAEVTAATGSNSFNKVYSNSISNVNYGIVFIGAGTTIAAIDNGNDIGGTSAGTGNTITNWGGGAALSTYISLTGSSYCIFDNQQINDNVSYNTITSAALTQSNTCGGILKNYSVASPTTGTITTTINNNTVTVTNNPTAATTGSVIGINNQGLTPLLATATMSMNNNTVQNCVLGGSTSTTNGITGITNLSLPGTMNMNGNSVINNSITATTATSGIINGMSNSGAAGTLNMNNNIIRGHASTSASGQPQGITNSGAVVTAININNNQLGNASGGFFSTSTVTSGTLFGIASSGGAATCALSIQGNDIRGITYSAAVTAAQVYIQNTAATLSQNISTNTYTNLNINSTGSVTFISNSVTVTATGTQTVSNNSIVTAFNKAGAGGTIQFFNSNGSSAAGATINHNNNNFSNITVTGSTIIDGWRNTDGGSPTKTFNGNTFTNWTGGTGTLAAMTINFGNPVVTNNIINNISGAGTVVGINTSGTSVGTGSFSGNTINTLSSTGAASTVSGIVMAGTTVSIFKNKIYDLSGNQAGTIINGINITSGTTINIYNNLIGDLRATAATGLNAIVGINAGATSTYNVYYNSIYLNATSSSVTTFGTSCITFSSTATSFNSRNNILYNSSVPAQEGANTAANGISACLRRSAGTAATVPANYAITSNNNAYWVNPAAGTNNHLTYVEGTSTITNPQNTFANMKAFMASRDQGSVQENVSWQSTSGASANFLKFSTGTDSQLESGAVNIATFTDDYAGTIRQGNPGYAGGGTAPDIGAWELEGSPADFIGPNIAYTPLSFTCGTGNRTLTATITDASGVPTAGAGLPVLYWKINAGAYTAVTGTHAGGSSYTFTFGAGVTVGDVVSYYIVAQDNFGNLSAFPSAGAAGLTANPPAAATPPTTPSTYAISNTLSGTYTVGAAGTYTTLTAAIAAYNTSCLGGAVTFSLIDAAYTTTSDTIKVNPDASAVNTLTIKPTLAATTITGNTTAATLVLQGADYVTIDGSIGATANTICPLSTASQDLSIINTNSGTSSAVIYLTSNGADGANNNTIKNCIITGNGATTTLLGVGSGGAAIGTASSVANNNNSYINNTINKAVFGVVSFGTSAATKNSGTIINQNTVATASPNNVSRGGIFAGYENGVVISGNNVSNVSGTSSNYAFGISCGLLSTTTTTTTGSDVTNAIITKNKIGSIRAASTYGVSGIAVASVTSGTTLIANNMISDAFANGTLSDIGAGIYVGGGTGSTTNVYHNSITMTATLTGGSYSNFGIAVNGSNPTVDLRNNIVVNTGNSGTGANKALGFAYSTFTNLTSDNNDLYVSGTSSGVVQTVTLSNSGFTNYTAITGAGSWNAASGKDAASLNILPVFVSASDLHLVPTSNAALNDFGSPVSVADDIDCETRSVTTPDMGADEFTPPIVTDAGVTAIVLPNPFCPGSNLVSATVKNLGTVTITSVLIDWSVTPGGAQPQVNPGAITLAPGASQTFPLGSFTFAAGTVYSITVATSSPNGGADGVPGNDAFTNPSVSTGLTGTYTVGAGGNYTTLTAAVADYNTKSLCGPVVFSLTDATYPTETFPITINSNAAASAVNTLTIKPASGISPVISGSNATALIDINNGDWITIDGSNNGTTSKDLTLSNTNTSGSVIRFINDATNNNVKNSILNGVSTSTSNGIVTVSTTTGTTGNDNNTIQNNTIAAGATANAYGFYNSGSTGSTAVKNSGLQVIGNNIFNFSSNGIRDDGGSVGTLYNLNQIYEVATQTTSLTGFRPSSTTIEGFKFTRNNIYDLKTTGTGTVYGIHLFDIIGNASIIGEVSNNMVVIDATTPLTAKGIYDQTATGEYFNIYYNSVVVSGTVTGASNSEAYHWAIASTSNVKNNIFVNTRNGGTGKHYAIRFTTTLANITSDYNDIYAGGGTGNVFGNDGTADRIDLAAWQAATVKDANSASILPVFVSATDLHLVPASNCTLHRRGTPIAGLTIDFDNDTRNATRPDMGADEYSIPTGGTITWTGAVSTDWFDVRNWNLCELPGPTSDVIINGALPNYPIVTANVTIKSIVLNPAATMTVATGVTFTLLGP